MTSTLESAHTSKQVAVLGIALAQLLLAPRVHASPSASESNYKAWASQAPAAAQYLSQQQLVVRGTLTEIVRRPRPLRGGCLGEGVGGIQYTFAVAVGEVLQGVSTTDTLHVGTLVPLEIDGLTPGASVVAWGLRSARDNWNLIGSIALVTKDGALKTIGDRRRSNQPSAKETDPSWATVRESMLEQRTLHGIHQMQDMRTLLLARVEAVTPEPADRSTYLLRPLDNTKQSTPQFVTYKITSPPHCIPSIQIGDTLCVPLQRDSGENDYTAICVDGLVVRCNFVPGLGISLDELKRSVMQTDAGSSVRLQGKRRM